MRSVSNINNHQYTSGELRKTNIFFLSVISLFHNGEVVSTGESTNMAMH